MRPMLATPLKGNAPPTGWVADHKLDGIRAIVRWEHGMVTIVNRNEVDVTKQFPDIEDALIKAFRGAGLTDTWLLDGELLASDGTFTSVATRAKQVKAIDIVSSMRRWPAVFVPFDLLMLAGRDVMAEPFRIRRMLLEETVSAMVANGSSIRAVVHSTDGAALVAATKKLGLEGVILKDPSSRYTPGVRSRAWVKIKNVQSVTCVATGYETGTGARAHFGAMNLAMIDGSTIVEVGRVGTGFTEKQILALKRELDSGRPVVVEIECLNRTGGNQLRFPVYKGWRTDLSVMDATIDQLENLPIC